MFIEHQPALSVAGCKLSVVKKNSTPLDYQL
jgi:hypothetical protein